MSRRDDDEFTAFVAASASRLRRSAFAICGDADVASDITREALIRLYEAWPRVEREGGVSAYADRAVVDIAEGIGRSPASRSPTGADDTDEPPIAYLEPDGVLRQAKGRVRKRRTIALVAVAAVVLTAGVAVGLTASNRDSTRIPPNPPIVRGPAINVRDAVAAKAGRDYTLVGTFVEDVLHHSPGRQFLATLSHDQVLYMDGPDYGRASFGTYDPATETSTTLPGLTDVEADGAFANSRWVIAYSSHGTMLDYDRSAQRVTTVSFTDQFGTEGGLAPVGFDSSGRAYVEYVSRSGDQPAIWSFDPANPSSLLKVSEIRGLVAALVGDTLVTTTGHGATATMHTLDVGSGATSTIPTQLPRRCFLDWLSPIGSQWLALQEHCGPTFSNQPGQIAILTTTGQPVMSIRGQQLFTTATNDRLLMFESTAGRLHGNYLFSPATGKLLYLSDVDITSARQWPPFASVGDEPIEWSQSFGSDGPVVDRFGDYIPE